MRWNTANAFKPTHSSQIQTGDTTKVKESFSALFSRRVSVPRVEAYLDSPRSRKNIQFGRSERILPFAYTGLISSRWTKGVLAELL